MRIDPTLPHHTYAVEVADALRHGPKAPTLNLVESGFGPPEQRLEARLTRRKVAVLIWRPDLGWRRATTQQQVSEPETAPQLTAAVVPSPSNVAAAWAAWQEGEDSGPYACAETSPAPGSLPGRLEGAVGLGELTPQVAHRLAAYVTDRYPHEELWHQRVVLHMDTGESVAGTMLPSTGDRYQVETPYTGAVWFRAHHVVHIEAA